MILPILVAIGIFLADRVFVSSWTRTGEVWVDFRVVDDSSGRPIGGASVEFSGGPDPLEKLTGADGLVSFAVLGLFEGTNSLLRDDRSGRFRGLARFKARGYQGSSTQINDRRQRTGRSISLPRPIVIRLKRLASH